MVEVPSQADFDALSEDLRLARMLLDLWSRDLGVVEERVSALEQATPQPQPKEPEVTLVNRPIRFKLDEAFLSVQSENSIRVALANYVDDMNTVLEKNTDLRLTYNAQSGCSFHPASQLSPSPVWGDFDEYPMVHYYTAYIKYHNSQTRGGQAWRTAVDEIGCFAMRWPRIWTFDESEINPVPVPNSYRLSPEDYCQQVETLLHELPGHGNGIAFSEYYSVVSHGDNTGIAPDLSSWLGDGPYWADKWMVLKDPMTAQNAMNRAELLGGCKFSLLSTHIINVNAHKTFPEWDVYQLGHWSRIPDQSQGPVMVPIKVADSAGNPVSGAEVRRYEFSDQYSSQTTPAATAFTDVNGLVSMEWGGGQHISEHKNNKRIFKALKSGYQNGGKVVSAFDLQANKLLPNGYDPLAEKPWDGNFGYGPVLTITLAQ